MRIEVKSENAVEGEKEKAHVLVAWGRKNNNWVKKLTVADCSSGVICPEVSLRS
jgi:hypothetical protein